MIQDHNLNITEQNYRDLDVPSYSLLASIAKQGVDVVKGEKVSLNLKYGSLVDMLCFEPHKVNDTFYKGASPKPPTKNVKDVCDVLLANITSKPGETQEVESELGRRRKRKITTNLKDYESDIVSAASVVGVYKNYTLEKLMDTVVDKGQEYFKDRLECRGKILIKPEMWAHAQAAAQTLQTHQFTGKYFNHKTPGVEIFYQFKFDTKVNGRRVKGMLDCLIVNHNAKVIIPVDLKTGEEAAINFPYVMLGHRYYLQAGLYREGLKSIVDNDFDLTGYDVRPFEFVYLSKMNVNKPLIFVVPDEFHEDILVGFTDNNGNEHVGLFELIERYYDCAEGGFCDYTTLELSNKGRIELDKCVRRTLILEENEEQQF